MHSKLQALFIFTKIAKTLNNKLTSHLDLYLNFP